ncbi:unnamed protein product [Paramecium pentaurelia]|uniref:Transmembrane protein n=1 Tax=Paramecium pentaurelia TaxID=43138 RepID=A0A8S1Y2K7_9CILI|nr:unnamed protein product [Paramecium pentaurelia]
MHKHQLRLIVSYLFEQYFRCGQLFYFVLMICFKTKIQLNHKQGSFVKIQLMIQKRVQLSNFISSNGYHRRFRSSDVELVQKWIQQFFWLFEYFLIFIMRISFGYGLVIEGGIHGSFEDLVEYINDTQQSQEKSGSIDCICISDNLQDNKEIEEHEAPIYKLKWILEITKVFIKIWGKQ